MLRITKTAPMSIALAIAFAVLFLVHPQPLLAQAITVTTNQEMPLNEAVFDCNGQSVTLSGTIHMVVHSTTNANGSTRLVIQSNYQDVSGTSPSNPGITYRGVHSIQTTLHSSTPQSEFTTIDNMSLISQGGTDNLRMKVTMHLTVNANGVTTAVVTRVETVCTG